MVCGVSFSNASSRIAYNLFRSERKTVWTTWHIAHGAIDVSIHVGFFSFFPLSDTLFLSWLKYFNIIDSYF